MSPADRRRLGAVSALVVGTFLGLTLLPAVPTGALGRMLGDALWNLLGIGAIGFPLLGIGLALAGFERLPRLNMPRVAILISGVSLLAPFVIGVLSGATADSLARETGAAPLVGWLPALLAGGVVGAIGTPGGLLLAFLALSALTILTVAWHPLQRLEKGGADGEDAGAVPPARKPRKLAAAEDHRDDDEVEAVLPPPRPESKSKKKAREGGDDLAPARTPAAGEEESELPPIGLLAAPPAQDTAADEAQLDRLGQSLLETLRTFKVEGTIAGRTSGPVVTQFEVVPAPGVKVGRIVALSDDLAVTMRATSVRVAPIPGKGAVGVEIPNPTARMVSLRELLEAAEWERTRAVLPVALGRDLEGKPVVADLAKMPHLLIAGATGAGKSVAINTIVTALIYRYTPKHLRLLMIDPKMVELSMYNSLPHLRHKVVTNNHDAARVLKWAVLEMNRRYELLHANGARNLADFNKKVADGKPLRNPAPPALTLSDLAREDSHTPPPDSAASEYTEGVLPFIVVIVDELADLMMTVQGEVETPLAMLAQKARAIGIHLILATQRPSVNVITGLIKANFPSRIAFRVASKVDSRTILDQNGAEALLGNGDMLFLPPGKSEPMRLQGAYIGTEETERVMDWYDARRAERLAAAAAPAPVEADILEMIRAQEGDGEEGGREGLDGERDPLFRQAAELCIQNQGGSTSLLQRRLSIGYGRASRILDQLEAFGILAPGNPNNKSRPRDVLIGMDQLDEYCG
jgi:S-DNA-T family DNA segregation ATPase FtsK/SpoIIIE